MPLLRTGPGPRSDQDTWLPPPSFGDTVRQARERAGLTKIGLSRRLAAAGAPVDPKTIGAWERGPQEPRPSTLITVLERTLGLQQDTLRVRLGDRTRDREAYDLRRHLRPERLFYVTTAIDQHVFVGADGRVTSIETTQRVRALVSGMTMCVFTHADDPYEDVQVRAVAGCETNYWWPRTRGLLHVRIGLTGPPLHAGEERALRYRVDHTWTGPRVPATPGERCHKANGTPTLERLTIRASFAEPGFRLRRCTWLTRHAEPLAGTGGRLDGTTSKPLTWKDPREETYGISWELPR